VARIIVQTEPTEGRAPAITWDEHVDPAHLTTDHSAAQLIERLAWAILDAQSDEQASAA
jgi:hypothetical protein